MTRCKVGDLTPGMRTSNYTIISRPQNDKGRTTVKVRFLDGVVGYRTWDRPDIEIEAHDGRAASNR